MNFFKIKEKNNSYIYFFKDKNNKNLRQDRIFNNCYKRYKIISIKILIITNLQSLSIKNILE